MLCYGRRLRAAVHSATASKTGQHLCSRRQIFWGRAPTHSALVPLHMLVCGTGLIHLLSRLCCPLKGPAVWEQRHLRDASRPGRGMRKAGRADFSPECHQLSCVQDLHTLLRALSLRVRSLPFYGRLFLEVDKVKGHSSGETRDQVSIPQPTPSPTGLGEESLLPLHEGFGILLRQPWKSKPGAPKGRAVPSDPWRVFPLRLSLGHLHPRSWARDFLTAGRASRPWSWGQALPSGHPDPGFPAANIRAVTRLRSPSRAINTAEQQKDIYNCWQQAKG